ncbi:MAG: hypothetical protein EB127_19285 [Alphaproteobacteria bacterium]|nr:hypothetical protein [Alphaproteobacteria bacterium]
MSNFTVITDDEAIELRKLRDFYKEVIYLTVNHDTIENEDIGIAVVYPNRLSTVLAKVDKDWFANINKN